MSFSFYEQLKLPYLTNMDVMVLSSTGSIVASCGDGISINIFKLDGGTFYIYLHFQSKPLMNF